MKIVPIGDRIVVRMLEAESETPGGLIIPDIAKERPIKGEVVAVGSGRYLDNGSTVPPEVKVGETVMFGRFSGNEVLLNGVEHRVMPESEIICVIEE